MREANSHLTLQSQFNEVNPERVRAALLCLSADDRAIWVRMAMAVKSEFGEEGFEIWDTWGATGEGHNAVTAKQVWKSIRKSGVNIGSLFYEAKQSGWADDKTHKKPSAAEIEARKKARAERDAAIAAEEARLAASAAERATAWWNAAVPAESHPYLTKKGVGAHGARIGTWEYTDCETGEVYKINGCLLIPIMDRQRKLHSLQCIEYSKSKPKRYLKDGAKRGHFYAIGKPKMRDGHPVFVLGEGFATCASVHEATGHMVLVCFDASNLLPVAQILRQSKSDAIIVFAADNDQWNLKPDSTPVNPGIDYATKAAAAVGGLVVFPPFTREDATSTDGKGNPGGPKDFNDWHAIKGAQSVADVIDVAISRPVTAVLAPDRQSATGAAIAMRALQLEDELSGDSAIFTCNGPSDLAIEVYGDDLVQRAAELCKRYPNGHIYILARFGDEQAAFDVAEVHGVRAEMLAEFGGGRFDNWFDAMMAELDAVADANLVAREMVGQVLDQLRPVPMRSDGAEGPANATRAGENEEFAVDPKAPFDIAHQLIARNWDKEGRRTLHRAGGAFYHWTGTHYEEKGDESVRATLYRELDKACRLEDGAPFKPDASSVNRVEDALRAAAHLPGERPSECWIDGRGIAPAREIIAVQNGLLHMPTRRLLPSDPNFFTLNSLPFNYDADAPQPVEWLKFLSTIWPNDPESIGLLQRWFGYILSSDTSHQKMLLLVGPKRSGKGTIARIMTSLLGKANVAGPNLSDFSNQFGLAQLIGRRAAIIGDARMSARADQGEIAGRLLSITGEDVLTIDRKHREPWIGTLPTRIVICSNELPRLQDASGALSSRFLILQMEQSFYGKEDRGLSERIESELPGILRWSLDGWDALQREGRFASPQSSMDALEELDGLSSPVKAFMKDVCEVNASALVDCAVLYREWCAWCKSQGRDHPGTQQTFGRDLRAAAAGVKTQQYRVCDGLRARRFVGIGLRGPT